MNEVIKAIKSRRSVRAYQSELLKKEEIDAIIEAGVFAPSANNQQPWHFTVLSGQATVGAVNKKCMELFAASSEPWMQGIAADPSCDITYHAPVLIILSAKKESGTGKADCLAALENMLLAAGSMGIGSCWMGLVSFLYGDAEAMKQFGVPEGYVAQESAVFGYAQGEAPEAPPRNMDVVNYLGECLR